MGRAKASLHHSLCAGLELVDLVKHKHWSEHEQLRRHCTSLHTYATVASCFGERLDEV
jgi:hypothetical protein